MSTKTFGKIKNAKPAPPAEPQSLTREQHIDQMTVEIMQRQIGDTAAALARAEAVNRRLHAENQALGAELQKLKGSK